MTRNELREAARGVAECKAADNPRLVLRANGESSTQVELTEDQGAWVACWYYIRSDEIAKAGARNHERPIKLSDSGRRLRDRSV